MISDNLDNIMISSLIGLMLFWVVAGAAVDSSNYSGGPTITLSGTPTATLSGTGGGGGGGGGGGVSGENFTNIEIKEKHDQYIFKDRVASYVFTNVTNPVVIINITGNTSAGEINIAVEVLKNTSSLVKDPAPGTVYKNLNIWVGTSGFASSRNIKDAIIVFRVLNSWMQSNGFAGSDIKLVRWDGSHWVQHEITEKNKDGTYTYFEAKTIAFSNFAITGLKGEIVPAATPGFETAVKATLMETPAATETKKKGTPGFGFAFTMMVLSALYLFARKRR